MQTEQPGVNLRAEAELRLADRTTSEAVKDTRSESELMHELQVHQIELEMQNEELRRAQQIIEESRDRYVDLYDFAPVGYLTLNRSAIIVEANLVGAELFGLPRKHLLNRSFSSLVSQPDRENWTRRFMNAMNQGEKMRSEMALIRADGSLFHAQLDCLHLDHGDNPAARIVLTDITERWLAQQHLAGLVAASMDAMINVDENQRIVLFNPAAEHMFGLPAAKALGSNLDRLLPKSSRAIHAEHLRAIAGAGTVSHSLGELGVLRARRANGELFPIEAALAQVEANGHRRFTVILREVTERMRVEQALRDSQVDLNRAQAVGQIGSWRLNLQRNELNWSDENHHIFGIAKDTPLTYESFLAAVHPDDRQFVDHMWQAALHGAPYDIEHRLLLNGEVKWVRERAELEFDAAGKLLGAFGTTQDITELKLAEQELIEADRRKDEFLAMLGHELRNPLTPIRNAAHVLGRIASPEPKVRWAQEIIERQVVHLTRLVDDLLDVSRIVRGKVELQQQIVSLADVVERALVMARPLIEAKGHRFDLHMPQQSVLLRGDPVRLAQVLLNLLDNAAKYTPDRGYIELDVSVEEALIEIRLCDNGMGIPQELQPRIFDSFQQGARSLDRAQGGLGIGLTLAKRLVEMHGGSIEVFSAGPGMGAEFTLRLPIWIDVETAAGVTTKQPAAAAGCRVLVVDDEPDVADSMTALLQIEGHEVRTASNGEAALELAQDFHPRLVLLDIGLRGMDGYEVARRLRARQSVDEKLCLVAVTGYGDEDARSSCEDAGFDGHLVKPVFPEAICNLLAEIASSKAVGAACQ